MTVPAKGTFGDFSKLSLQDMLSPFSNLAFEHVEPTRHDLQEASLILDLEYRNTGTELGKAFITQQIKKTINRDRLKNFSLYLPIVQNIIDMENPNYVRPPVRRFLVDDKPVGDDLADYISGLYTQMDWDNEILYISRQAAYMGTVLVFPSYDVDRRQMVVVKLTPADPTLEVIGDPIIRTLPIEVTWVTENEAGDEVQIEWNEDEFISVTKTASGDSSKRFKHQNGRIPVSILRYIKDSNRFWGPYDGGLESLIKTRSLLLSDSIYRSQTNLFEFLVFQGFTPAEALSAAQTKSEGVASFENEKDDMGKPQAGSKDIKYVSPEGIAPKTIFDLWLDIYNHFLRARGHNAKNFDSSNMIQTAEAMRFSNIGQIEAKEAKRNALAEFEQSFLDNVVWSNNTLGGAKKLPDGLTVLLDWQPDKQFFNNATDKSNFYQFALKHNLLTPPIIIRQENPELTKEEAEQVYIENKKFNKENEVVADPVIADPNDKPGQEDPKE